MIIAIVTLIVLAAVLLILLVLAQDPKSGGFNSGIAGTQFMGVQKTTDLLEKLTWGLAGAIFLFSITTNFMVDKGGEGFNSANIEAAKDAPAAPAPAPAQQQQPGQGQAPVGQPAPTPSGQPAPEPAAQ